MYGVCLLLILAQMPEARPQPAASPRLMRAALAQQAAAEQFQQAKVLYATALAQQAHDQLVEASRTLEQVVRLDPDALEPRRTLVPLLLALQRPHAALPHLDWLVSQDAADWEAWERKGQIHRDFGEPRLAAQAWSQAIRSPRLTDDAGRAVLLFRDLGRLQVELGDDRAARTAFGEVVRRLQKGPIADPDELQKAHEQIGYCALRQQDWSAARTAFESAIAVAERAGDGWAAQRLNWYRAEVAVGQKDWPTARKLLEAYLARQPTDVTAYERWAFILRQLDQTDALLPGLRRYAAQQPDLVGLQLLLARTLAEQNQPNAADKLYQELAERTPTVAVYRAWLRLRFDRGQLNQILALLNAALPLEANDAPTPVPVTERRRAVCSALRSEAALVRALIPVAVTAAAADDKQQFQTLMLLGALAAQTRDLAAAEKVFRQCLQRPPEHAEAGIYASLLSVLWQLHQPSAIVDLCRAGLQRGPRQARHTNPEYLQRHLALALAELGKTTEALEVVDLGLEWNVNGDRYNLRLCKVDVLLWSERFNAALTEAERLLRDEKSKDHLREVRFRIASAHAGLKDHERAAAVLRQMVEDDPDDARAHNDLGYQLADLGRDLDEAERLIRRAVDLDRSSKRRAPEEEASAAYLDSLGWILFRQGKLVEARQWLTKASQLGEGRTDPTVWDHLGDVLYRLHEPASAKAAWEQARQLLATRHRGRYQRQTEELERKLARLKGE
jgi:tetratricopeptide (TPR) repeat protein